MLLAHQMKRAMSIAAAFILSVTADCSGLNTFSLAVIFSTYSTRSQASTNTFSLLFFLSLLGTDKAVSYR